MEEIWQIEYLCKPMTMDEVMSVVYVILFHEDVSYFGYDGLPQETDFCMN